MENKIIVKEVSVLLTEITHKITFEVIRLISDYEVVVIKNDIESKFKMLCSDYPTYGMIIQRYNEIK